MPNNTRNLANGLELFEPVFLFLGLWILVRQLGHSPFLVGPKHVGCLPFYLD